MNYEQKVVSSDGIATITRGSATVFVDNVLLNDWRYDKICMFIHLLSDNSVTLSE